MLIDRGTNSNVSKQSDFDDYQKKNVIEKKKGKKLDELQNFIIIISAFLFFNRLS
jgi:hypothetical protein